MSPISPLAQTAGPNRCGPVVLSQILASRGLSVSPDRVAELAKADLTGTTLLGLKRAAQALGVPASGMRLTLGELADSVGKGRDVIAFVGGDHYVWVRAVLPGQVRISDDTPGQRVVAAEAWQAMWAAGGGAQSPAEPEEEPRGICLVLGLAGGEG